MEDPRAARGVRHRLDEVLAVRIFAVICGAEACEGSADFGQAKEAWPRTFLTLRYGIPCGEKFRRILAALDGKRLRSSFDRAGGKAAIHRVGAWASASGLAHRVWATDDLAWFTGKDRRPGLRTWAAVEGDRTRAEQRCFISSLPTDAKTLGLAVRRHWQIENGRHWGLDVTFAEDRNRLHTGHAAENPARFRRIALSLLKQETPNKRGIKTKRLHAGWNQDYPLKILTT